MTKGMKVLIAVLLVEVVAGGLFVGWIYFGVNLVSQQKSMGNTSQQAEKNEDPNVAELKSIEKDLTVDADNDTDLKALDDISKELDKVNLSGI